MREASLVSNATLSPHATRCDSRGSCVGDALMIELGTDPDLLVGDDTTSRSWQFRSRRFGLSASGVFALRRSPLARSLSNGSIACAPGRDLRRAHRCRSVRARSASRGTQLFGAKSGGDAPDLRPRGFAFLHRRSRSSRWPFLGWRAINVVYAADLTGAAAGCLALDSASDRLGARAVVLSAATLALIAAVLFAPPALRLALHRRRGGSDGRLDCRDGFGLVTFDVTDAPRDTSATARSFSKWNCVFANRRLRTHTR